MALSTIPTRALTEQGINFRNLIINGDMSIAQRGTSSTGQTGAGYVVCDRWQHNASGGTLNLTQNSFTLGQSDVPSLFKNYFTISATTGADNCGIWQKVEDVRSVQGTYTISWYAKGTNPNGGHLELALRQNFGSGGSADVDLTSYNFTLTSSWQRFSYTFTTPSLSGKTVGSSSYFRLYLKQPVDDNTSNAWSMDVTGVQLEVGTSASDFEFLPYDVNLNRCLRYCNVYGERQYSQFSSASGAYSTSQGQSVIGLPVEMRAVPSLSYTGNFRMVGGSNSGTITSIAISTSNCSKKVFVTESTVSGSALVVDRPYALSANNDTSARLTLDAEL